MAVGVPIHWKVAVVVVELTKSQYPEVGRITPSETVKIGGVANGTGKVRVTVGFAVVAALPAVTIAEKAD